MAEVQPVQQKGFWARLGFFQKAIIVICLIIFGILLFNFFTGNVRSLYDFLVTFGSIVAILVVLYYLVRTLFGMFKPKPFSPRDSFFTKIVNIAKDIKPNNVYDLYFSGDVGRQRTRYGKIVGLTAIPYLVGKTKTDSEGNIVYSDKKDPYNKKRFLPEYEKIELSEDYDILFVVKQGLIFPKFHYLRAPPRLCSSLNGDVEIYDINPSPYGRWEYPFKVMQQEVRRLTVQHQLEAVLEVHEQQHDFASVLVDAALGFNPNWQMVRRTGEQLGAVQPNA